MPKVVARLKNSKAHAPDASRALHAAERKQAILSLLKKQRFVTFRSLEREIEASPATLRRDLERLASEGHLSRVHGAIKLVEESVANPSSLLGNLKGVPFYENMVKNPLQKKVIGRAAAALCHPGEAVIIDGGSTTLQMCPHLSGMHLQVFTNSLHIVSALLPMPDIRLQVPGGTVFREQSIILGTSDEETPKFKAPQLFMGAAAVTSEGILQADLVLVAAERRLIERAEELILLVDSSKFHAAAGNLLCPLEEVDVVVTDARIGKAERKMLDAAEVRLVIA